MEVHLRGLLVLLARPHAASFFGVFRRDSECCELSVKNTGLKAKVRYAVASITEEHFKECSKTLKTNFVCNSPNFWSF